MKIKSTHFMLSMAACVFAPVALGQVIAIHEAILSGDGGASGTNQEAGIGFPIALNTTATTINSLDILLSKTSSSPNVTPTPSIQICADASNAPNLSACTAFTHRETNESLGLPWAENVYKLNYQGSFPISNGQTIWVLATPSEGSARTWFFTNWKNSLNSYSVAYLVGGAWSVYQNDNLGVPISLYSDPSRGSVTPATDSTTGNAGTPITPLNVLANDLVNGAQATTSNATLSVVTPAAHAGVVLDTSTGTVSTTAAVPAGTYTITYNLCSTDTTPVCANTTATVVLSDTPPQAGTVTPATDSATGTAGTPITPLNVLANDLVNGAQATTSNATLSVVTPAANAGVVLNTSTGTVSTTAAVPAGTYTITYNLCSTDAAPVCAQSTATVMLNSRGQVASVPTLSESMLLLLGGWLIALGAPALRRR